MIQPRFTCGFKLEAVRLVGERPGTIAPTPRSRDVHWNVPCKYVKDFAANPQVALPGMSA